MAQFWRLLIVADRQRVEIKIDKNNTFEIYVFFHFDSPLVIRIWFAYKGEYISGEKSLTNNNISASTLYGKLYSL